MAQQLCSLLAKFQSNRIKSKHRIFDTLRDLTLRSDTEMVPLVLSSEHPDFCHANPWCPSCSEHEAGSLPTPKLLHSTSLLAVGLSVGYGSSCGLLLGRQWDAYISCAFCVNYNALRDHVTSRNSHCFPEPLLVPCTVLMTGNEIACCCAAQGGCERV